MMGRSETMQARKQNTLSDQTVPLLYIIRETIILRFAYMYFNEAFSRIIFVTRTIKKIIG